MSLTDNTFQSDANPGVSRTNQSPVTGVVARSGINQIRGINVSGATGSGIPKHVTNISASVSNAQSGATSVLTATFRRDPSDSAYAGVNIYVKGYQGNQTPVQVASGIESPVTCVLNNTGEALSVIIQATGNGGFAPIKTAPTTGAQLPKSTTGGYGTNTVIAYNVTTPPPGFAISGTPRLGDTIRYNENGDSNWDAVIGYPFSYFAAATLFGTGFETWPSQGAGLTPTTVGTVAKTAATATEPVMENLSKTATASTNAAVCVLWPNGGAAGIGFGTIRRWACRTRLNNTSSVRYWVGLSEFTATIATTSWVSDTPNFNYVAFRFSATTDTHIKAVAATSSGAQTVVDTGISVDTTNSQFFEIVQDSSNVYYYINGALVATISSNIPARSTLMLASVIGDNKNTATAMSFDYAHMRYTIK